MKQDDNTWHKMTLDDIRCQKVTSDVNGWLMLAENDKSSNIFISIMLKGYRTLFVSVPPVHEC